MASAFRRRYNWPAVIDRFLHLTDFHFWEVVLNPFRLLNKRIIGDINVILKRRHEFPIDRADTYADYVGSLGAPDALLTGDFASTATPREFELGRRFVERLQDHGLDIVAIPGNHDVYTFESVRKRRFEHFFSQWLPREPLPCVFNLRGGTPVLLIPTVRPNFMSSQGYVSQQTIQDVETLLSETERSIIVAAHYPLIHWAKDYVAPVGRRLLHADALREVVGRHPYPVLYIAGHNHRFHLEQDKEFGHLTHVCTGSFLWQNEHLGTKGEFCEFGVDETMIQVIRHVRRDTWAAERLEPIRF